MKLENIIINLLIISSAVIGCSSLYISISNNYGITVTDMSYLNKTSEVVQHSAALTDSLRTITSGDSGLEEKWYAFNNAIQETLKLNLSLIDTFTGLISDAAEIMGLPEWFFVTLTVIITIIIIFAVLNAGNKTEV